MEEERHKKKGRRVVDTETLKKRSDASEKSERASEKKNSKKCRSPRNGVDEWASNASQTARQSNGSSGKEG